MKKILNQMDIPLQPGDVFEVQNVYYQVRKFTKKDMVVRPIENEEIENLKPRKGLLNAIRNFYNRIFTKNS